MEPGSRHRRRDYPVPMVVRSHGDRVTFAKDSRDKRRTHRLGLVCLLLPPAPTMPLVRGFLPSLARWSLESLAFGGLSAGREHAENPASTIAPWAVISPCLTFSSRSGRSLRSRRIAACSELPVGAGSKPFTLSITAAARLWAKRAREGQARRTTKDQRRLVRTSFVARRSARPTESTPR
jgi:hypothetical protein